jgi:hypothetical protein
MREERTADRRIEQAQYVTLLPFVLTLVGIGVALVFYFMAQADVHPVVTWWSVVWSVSVTAAYGLAAWLIGKRRAAGGYLAIILFGWAIAASLWRRQMSFNALYSLVAIAVVMRAAAELNLKWRLPSPR